MVLVSFEYLKDCSISGYLGLLSMCRESNNVHHVYLSKPSAARFVNEQPVLETLITAVNWDYERMLVWRLRRDADRLFDVPECVIDYVSRQRNVGQALPMLLKVFGVDVTKRVVKCMKESEHTGALHRLTEKTRETTQLGLGTVS